MYLIPYRNEDNCCSVIGLIYRAEYLDHAEVEYHLPIISFSIIVFAYFLKKIFRFVYNCHSYLRIKIVYKVNIT